MKHSGVIVTSIASITAAYVGLRYGALLQGYKNPIEGINSAPSHLIESIAHDPFALPKTDMSIFFAVAAFLGVWILWAWFYVRRSNFRIGEEHGSARWGSYKEGRAFQDTENSFNNILLTNRYALRLKSKKFDLETDRNHNVLIVGGPGSGKTRYYVKPNLCQLNTNYFLTDPKGTALLECGHLFEESGYEIRSFNTIEFDKSMHYNPLAYVKTDAEILSFVTCLIKNTTPSKAKSSDPFWEKAEILLYIALIAYLRDWAEPEDYTLTGLLYLLTLAKASEDNENYQSPLDLIFDEIKTKTHKYVIDQAPGDSTYSEREREVRKASGKTIQSSKSKLFNRTLNKSIHDIADIEDDFALKNYQAFKTAAGKTIKSIIISCNVRLKPLEISQVKDLISHSECELRLDELGDEGSKIALFAILSDTDKTFSFLFAILMWQTMKALCDKALITYKGSLPTCCHFIFDEFANIGTLPDFAQTIAVTRSRNIAISVILQSLSQLKMNYSDDEAKVITDNCDTLLFLGGKSQDTNKQISDAIGQETIDMVTSNQSKGQSASYTKNQQVQGRALIDPAEVARVSRAKAILLISGTYPLIDDKYRLDLHPRYDSIDPGHVIMPKGIARLWQKPKPSKYTELYDYSIRLFEYRQMRGALAYAAKLIHAQNEHERTVYAQKAADNDQMAFVDKAEVTTSSLAIDLADLSDAL